MVLFFNILLIIIIIALIIISGAYLYLIKDSRIIKENVNNIRVQAVMLLSIGINVILGGYISLGLVFMCCNYILLLIEILIISFVVGYLLVLTVKYSKNCRKTSVMSEQYCLLKNEKYMIEKFEMFLWEIKNNHFDKANAEFGISYKEFCDIQNQLSLYKNISIEDYSLERMNETCFSAKIIINADNDKISLRIKIIIKDGEGYTLLGAREIAYLKYGNFSIN